MSKINILDKDIYNKIAAGEVVEKPASVVKELVENSIDAGATSIVVEILEGGIKQIKVNDNGCGIEKDDFDKVFLAHATSKIKTIDDLGQIGTLGFRGEALSSIASVSKITLSSKTEDDIGNQVKVIGGEMGDIEPIGATNGTYIIVEDLFFNIPARKKFLRKPKLEENDITNYMARLIMANPNIAIKYSADNKIIYHSFGTGLYDAIYAIYGKTIVDNIFEFDFVNGNYHFNGYLGKPTYSKPNRTYQTLLINGRYVINQTISTAVYKAYENFIMKGNFPFFVINLEIPLDKVDVNVHPNKLDVKFEDSNHIFGIVYNMVIDLLYNINNTKTITIEDTTNNSNIDESLLSNVSNIGSEYSNENVNDVVKTYSFETTKIGELKTINKTEDYIEEVDLSDNKEIEYESNKIESDSQYNLLDNNSENDTNKNSNRERIIPFFTSKTLDFHIASSYKPEEKNAEDNEIINNENIALEQTQTTIDIDTLAFKTIGVIFNTYIIIEYENEIILIDQHAGHERILFDKFNQELLNKQVAIQPLLIPFILETNYSEANFITNNTDTLQELGFEIENFGDNSFKVSTVPVLLENIDLQEFFDKLLSDIDNKLILSKNDTIKEYLAKSACKTAVKGNDKLSDNEIQFLINQVSKPDQVLLCPHGRPIAVKLNQKEIEKWFKRIV